jgi:DNA polymerase-3 subunit gamma/tau
VDGAAAAAEAKTAPKVAEPQPPAPKVSETSSPAPTTLATADPVSEARTVSIQQMRDSWPEILEVVQKAKRNAWMVVYTSEARALDGDILTVTFPSETDVANFKQPQGAGEGVSEYLRNAIVEVIGLRVKFIAKVEPTLAALEEETALADETEPEPTEPDTEPAVDAAGWAVAEIPASLDNRESSSAAAKPAAAKQTAAPMATAATSAAEPQRYGESVVREILSASFIEEQAVAPRVTPREN